MPHSSLPSHKTDSGIHSKPFAHSHSSELQESVLARANDSGHVSEESVYAEYYPLQQVVNTSSDPSEQSVQYESHNQEPGIHYPFVHDH